jgi:hypothetical protein
LSRDLNRKLLAGTPLQRELARTTARIEEVRALGEVVVVVVVVHEIVALVVIEVEVVLIVVVSRVSAGRWRDQLCHPYYRQ